MFVLVVVLLLSGSAVVSAESAETYYGVGLAHYREKQNEQAIKALDQAIALQPEYGKAYGLRGLVHERLNHYDQAIADFSKFIDLDPQNAGTYLLRGRTYLWSKQQEKSISDLSTAITLNPRLAEAYYYRGLAYAELTRYDHAVSDFGQAIAIKPQHANSYIRRGIAYRSLERYEQAISDFEQAIALKPREAEAYYQRSLVYTRLKQYEKVITDCDQAIALRPDYAKAYAVKGVTLPLLGRTQEAIDALRQCIRIGNDPTLVDIAKKSIVKLGGTVEAPPVLTQPAASQAPANRRLFVLATTDKAIYYLDTDTLTVTKDDNNRTYYDTWIIAENKQDVPEVNIVTKQNEQAKRTLLHITFVISAEQRTIQLWSITSYTQNGKLINTHAPVKPKTETITQKTIVDMWCKKTEEYIAKTQIKPIAVPNKTVLPATKQDFFALLEAKGYTFQEVAETQKYNPFNGTHYTASASSHRFRDKIIEKEVHLSVGGDDKDHLTAAHVQFALEGPNYRQTTKKLNLPDKDKLDLFYTLLQVLFPDWPKKESKQWIDQSIATMNQKNTLMFIHLHKGKEYITISRQPVQSNEVVQYVLKVSQNQPSGVNPLYPYRDEGYAVSVYQKWNAGKKDK